MLGVHLRLFKAQLLDLVTVTPQNHRIHVAGGEFVRNQIFQRMVVAGGSGRTFGWSWTRRDYPHLPFLGGLQRPLPEEEPPKERTEGTPLVGDLSMVLLIYAYTSNSLGREIWVLRLG